jgi:hypothetical protein
MRSVRRSTIVLLVLLMIVWAFAPEIQAMFEAAFGSN